MTYTLEDFERDVNELRVGSTLGVELMLRDRIIAAYRDLVAEHQRVSIVAAGWALQIGELEAENERLKTTANDDRQRMRALCAEAAERVCEAALDWFDNGNRTPMGLQDALVAWEATRA